MFNNIIVQHFALFSIFLMIFSRKMIFTLSAKNYEKYR